MDPIAFVLCGGNGAPNEHPATVRFLDYFQAACMIGPRIKAAGIKRICYHNPGGDFWLGWNPIPTDVHNKSIEDAARRIGIDTRVMHINQWLLAEQCKCRFADRNALAVGHYVLRHYFGIEEVIYYLGSPDIFANAAVEAPRCVEMFLDCGAGASLAFDAVAWDTSRIRHGDDICQWFADLRAKGCKVYVEPRLNAAQIADGIGEFIDGTIAAADFDLGPFFKPDLKSQPGETIRGPIVTTESLPADMTRLVRDASDKNWT